MPTNKKSLKELEEINIILQETNTKYCYPTTWVINPPNNTTVVAAQAAKIAADKILAKRKAEKKVEKKTKKKGKQGSEKGSR
jgi:hypothetical protein